MHLSYFESEGEMSENKKNEVFDKILNIYVFS